MSRTLLLAVTYFICACSNPNTILEKSPFASQESPLPRDRVNEFIARSEDFASRNNLRAEVNRFGDNKFSILIYDRSINITVINTVRNEIVQINAISREDPTRREEDLFRGYVTAIRP